MRQRDASAPASDDARRDQEDDQPERTDTPLTEILDQLESHCESDQEKVTFGEVLKGFDRRGFAPLLLVPGLIALGPTGVIPGMSIACGTVIILVSLQILAGRKSPWLPERVKNFEFGTDKLGGLVKRSRSTTEFLDRQLKERWPFFAEGVAARLGAIFCLIMALTMYPLALVPFGVALPAAAIVIFSLGLASKDGLLVIGSNLFGLGALGLAVWFLISVL